MWNEEYKRIRGREYRVPDARTVYFGPVEVAGLGHLDYSIEPRDRRPAILPRPISNS